MIDVTVFGALVSICDRLVSLIQHRHECDKETFEKLIEPAFLQLSDVHTDYLAGFADVIRLIEDESVTSTQLKEELLARKRNMQSLRDMNVSLFKALARITYDEGQQVSRRQDSGANVLAFLFEVMMYFEGAIEVPLELIYHSRDSYLFSGTHFSGFLMRIKDFADGKVPRDQLLSDAENLVWHMSNRWKLICESYARLKVRVYSVN